MRDMPLTPIYLLKKSWFSRDNFLIKKARNLRAYFLGKMEINILTPDLIL